MLNRILSVSVFAFDQVIHSVIRKSSGIRTIKLVALVFDVLIQDQALSILTSIVFFIC